MKKTQLNDKRRRVLLGVTVAMMILAGLLVAWLMLLFVGKVQVVLTGPGEVTLDYGTAFRDEGATATYRGFALPKNMRLRVERQGSVDVMKPGKYLLTYSASCLGKTSRASRTVWVVDRKAPIITLTVKDGTFTKPGEPYVEEGYTAVDEVDGDLTDKVVAEERDGVVYYSVTDSSGNKAEARRVIHYGDSTLPVITLSGGAALELPAGTPYVEPGYTAMDNGDGDLTASVVVTGEVNPYLAGDYLLTYTVSDSFQNTATVTRKVTVVPKPQPDTVNPGSKIVYLTFDDGPSGHTQELLDVLDLYNVKVTFFVVNHRNQDLIAEEAKRGHSVGIHSESHDYKKIYASEEAYFADLEAMNDIIESYTGSRTTLLRFPGGSSNRVSSFNPGIMTTLTKAVVDMGFQYFDWNVESGDAGKTTDTQVVFQNTIEGIQKHDVSVVLQHDSKGYSVAAVEQIITWGLANGYTFLPLTPESPVCHHHVNN